MSRSIIVRCAVRMRIISLKPGNYRSISSLRGVLDCEQSSTGSDLAGPGLSLKSEALRSNVESQVWDLDRICRIVCDGGGDLEQLEANLRQSGVIATSPLMAQVIHRCCSNCDEAVGGRRVLRFFDWCSRQPGCNPTDEIFNGVVEFFARRKDTRAMEIVMAMGEVHQMGLKTFGYVIETLVREGRDRAAVNLFKKRMEASKCKGDERTFRIVACALCEKGLAKQAECLMRKQKIAADDFMYNTLVHGWCVAGKGDEARRVMSTDGFSPGVTAFNALLNCICNSCALKNTQSLLQEANDIVSEMKSRGVSPNQTTFNTLIAYLCRIRKAKDAYNQFVRMKECGCSPNSLTYFLIVKAMYLTARLADGDKVLDEMIEAGFRPDAKTYCVFIAALCRLERLDHALQLFARMKEDGCQANARTFDLLISKLCRGGKFDQGSRLWNEAVQNGCTLISCPDLLDPAKTE